LSFGKKKKGISAGKKKRGGGPSHLETVSKKKERGQKGSVGKKDVPLFGEKGGVKGRTTYIATKAKDSLPLTPGGGGQVDFVGKRWAPPWKKRGTHKRGKHGAPSVNMSEVNLGPFVGGDFGGGVRRFSKEKENLLFERGKFGGGGGHGCTGSHMGEGVLGGPTSIFGGGEGGDFNEKGKFESGGNEVGL